MRAKNAWRVYWVENGKRKYRHFEGSEFAAERNKTRLYGDPLAEAAAYAKQLKRSGHSPELVSCRRAFIQTKDQKNPPGPGYTWCPYCIKWRKFHLSRIRRATYTSPGANRCPVCLITDENYYVRRYNGQPGNLTPTEIRRMLSKR